MGRRHLFQTATETLTEPAPAGGQVTIATGTSTTGTEVTVTTRGLTAAASPPDRMHWEGVLAVEGEMTGDGRLVQAGALTWQTPMPLTWRPDGGGHDEASVVGTVWEVERVGAQIVGRGTFDLGHPDGLGLEAARQVAEGLTDGVSMELDSMDAELRVRLADMPDDPDAMPDVDDLPTDEDGRAIVDAMAADDVVEAITAARMRTMAMVTTPAFDGAIIGLADGITLDGLRAGEFPHVGDPDAPADTQPMASEPDESDEFDAVTAAATPLPPAAWFDNPRLDAPTPLTIEASGRVYGHLARWGTCHIGRNDRCVTPPRGGSYRLFATGATRVACDCPAGWDLRPTGTLTIGGGHADLRADAAAAAAHYDDVGTGWADVAVGEDAHGIWIAGAVRPGVDDDTVRRAQASALSGDWRSVGGRMELVAALSVNVPGFPVERTPMVAAGIHHDVQVSLVASGMVTRPDPVAQLADRLAATEARLARLEMAAARGRVAAGLSKPRRPAGQTGRRGG